MPRPLIALVLAGLLVGTLAPDAHADTQPFQRPAVAEGWGVAVAAADLDADGREDLAVVRYGQVKPGLSIYHQQADGTLTEKQVASSLPSASWLDAEPTAVDLNADGRSDLVVATRDGVVVYLQRDHELSERQVITFGEERARYVEVLLGGAAGAPSILVGTGGVSTAGEPNPSYPEHVLTNDGQGRLSHGPLFRNASCGFADVADLDRDGRQEQVGWLNPPGPNPEGIYPAKVCVQRLQDDMAAEAPVLLTLANNLRYIQHVVAQDVDGDGRQDLVLTGLRMDGAGLHELEVLLNRGAGQFEAHAYPSNVNVQAIAVADVDGDSRKDVVVTHAGYADVGVYLNQGSGLFGEEQLHGMAEGFTDGRAVLSVADLDGNGLADIAAANTNVGAVLIRQGPARVVTAEPVRPSASPTGTPAPASTAAPASSSPSATAPAPEPASTTAPASSSPSATVAAPGAATDSAAAPGSSPLPEMSSGQSAATAQPAVLPAPLAVAGLSASIGRTGPRLTWSNPPGSGWTATEVRVVHGRRPALSAGQGTLLARGLLTDVTWRASLASVYTLSVTPFAGSLAGEPSRVVVVGTRTTVTPHPLPGALVAVTAVVRNADGAARPHCLVAFFGRSAAHPAEHLLGRAPTNGSGQARLVVPAGTTSVRAESPAAFPYAFSTSR